jgi:hypothetical protein
MKKALVIGLLVMVGLGAAAFAGPLSGQWCANFAFDWALVATAPAGNAPIQAVTIPAFTSTLELDYTVCGWTFMTTADFNKHHFANLYLEAQGSVGAFGFYGILDFVPQSPSFGFLIGFVDVSIAGVNLYGGGGINDFNDAETIVPDHPLTAVDESVLPLIGVGWVVGGYGVAGDCAVWVEAQFNFCSLIGTIYNYGYETMIDQILYTDVCLEQKPSCGVQTESCCPCWVGLDVYVDYAFACFDVTTKVAFDCEVGFDSVCFEIDDICTGLDWLLLDDLNICFNVQTKSVCGQLELVLADCVCFTPYLSLVMDADNNARITGIEINALTVEYDMGQGVTFKAGTFFDTTWGDSGFRKVDESGISVACDEEGTWCWDSNGGLVLETYYADCCINNAYDEYFAVLIDGDACCGGAFAVEIYNWFDDDQDTAFMDYVETDVDITVGVGANTTLSFGFDLGQAGLLNWSLGWCFEW